ncbi:MAG: hypothetical protein HY074_17735, partial [Deltaproteobacteria bacterium]|nr:hypothetical protein [Deltaproteobacteria bacterium]
RPDFSDSLEIMQSLGALVFAVLSIVVPKLMWRNKGREFRDAPGGEPPALNVLIGVYYVPWIIRMAFLNSVTIFGFVISITKHSPARIIPFFVASMIGYLFNFPSEDRIKTSVMNN